MKKKLFSVILLALTAVMIFGTLSVSAIEPYQTYTYSIDGEMLPSPAAYTPARTTNVNAKWIFEGLEEGLDTFCTSLNTLYDITADSDGNVYPFKITAPHG